MQASEKTAAMAAPVSTDILAARQTLSRYLARTPLVNYPALDAVCGTRILVKHENNQMTGAFKVRGGINLVAQLPDDERNRGVISASTGNHGQSIAYAARLFGVRAVIVVPENANQLKVAAIEASGGEVVFHGADFDEAREHCAERAESEGLRYIHSANEPHLIAGVATITLEILEDAPDVTTIIVPVGGGSGAAGACLAAKTIDPKIQVIGVQAERAPAAYRSWKQRALLEDKMETAAEGLATRVAFEMTQKIMWQYLDDFILVGEEEMHDAVKTYAAAAHTLAETAGAASLAAAIKIRERLAGQTVALVLSGGNITPDHGNAAE
ncbi:MAG TPA: threonine/serine dehydratase [Pyrinomonadaceae bacterium]|nr:threonine/serine dehydratase [Pyrinomonadaceae bacterium]